MADIQDFATEPSTRTQADLREPRLWHQLGKQLHVVSYLKYPFWVLGIYFQFKTMFLSTGHALFDNLSRTLLMYGIAMSLESLRDSTVISQRKRAQCLSNQTAFRWSVAVVFAGGLFAIAVGCCLFFIADVRELGWALSAFGLGMLSLGRQQYDQLASLIAVTHAQESTQITRTRKLG